MKDEPKMTVISSRCDWLDRAERPSVSGSTLRIDIDGLVGERRAKDDGDKQSLRLA